MTQPKAIERRCGECGIGKVRPTKGEGRAASFKNMKLEIPAEMEIPTCDNCGAEWLNEAGMMELDAALERLYREEMRALFGEALGRVTAPMRRVESALGLSEGYLSKVKQGRSEPSANLVSTLALIARDSEGALSVLEGLGKHGPEQAWRQPSNPSVSQAREVSSMPSVADTYPPPTALAPPRLPRVPARKPKKSKRAPTGSRRGHRVT